MKNEYIPLAPRQGVAGSSKEEIITNSKLPITNNQ
jgi:hypothetical protein